METQKSDEVRKFRPFKKAAVTGSYIMAGGVIGEALCLYLVHSIWMYELFMIIILFALGMIFATSNTLAMNEGRSQAGEAAALLGIVGYIVGAVVSPLVGIGNILHSTAIIYLLLTLLVLLFSTLTRRLPPDLNN